MKKPLQLLLVATLLSGSAALAEDAKKAPAKDYPIVKFGNQQLMLSEVLETWKTIFPGGTAPDFNNFDENVRQNVLRGMVSEKLIYQEAMKAGFNKNPEVKKRVAEIEKQVTMQLFIESKAEGSITDAQLKAAYDDMTKNAGNTEELKARHILVKTEDEAKAVAAALKKGEKFEKLAKEKSSDKGSAEQGGDLGWFTKEKMIPEFANAAYALKKGEVSAPVKSGFGWHVIKLDDRRKMEPPSFEEAKEELKHELTEKAIEGYITDLVNKAGVKYYDAAGKEIPLNAQEKAPAAGGES